MEAVRSSETSEHLTTTRCRNPELGHHFHFVLDALSTVLRIALSWVITQRIAVISCRRFGLDTEDRTDKMSQNVVTRSSQLLRGASLKLLLVPCCYLVSYICLFGWLVGWLC